MKEKLTNKDTGSIEKLIKAIKVLWTTNMSRTYLKNLSESMPMRTQKVLAVNGQATSY
jgi:hypothetical protein